MRIATMAVVAGVALGVGPGRCEAPKTAQDRLLGEWVAVPAKDGAVAVAAKGEYTRLKVSRDGANWAVEGWVTLDLGRPVAAHAGKFRLHLLGDKVTDTELPYGLAQGEETYAKTSLTLRVEKDQLLVERYTVFTDQSGRANYRVAQTFRRK